MKRRPDPSGAWVMWTGALTACVRRVRSIDGFPPRGATTVEDHSGPEGDPPNTRSPLEGPPAAPEESPATGPAASSRWYSATVFASVAKAVFGRVKAAV